MWFVSSYAFINFRVNLWPSVVDIFLTTEGTEEHGIFLDVWLGVEGGLRFFEEG